VLIACANVANLLLVRASVREREIAIRAALGAGGRRLVGADAVGRDRPRGHRWALGVLLAYLAITPIRTLGADSIPRVADVVLDGKVVAFALLVTILTGLLFSVAPAWHAARGAFSGLLKEGARGSSARGHRVRSVLFVGEVALSIVLLVGAALLLRSFARLSSVDPGFRRERSWRSPSGSAEQLSRRSSAHRGVRSAARAAARTSGRPARGHGADHSDSQRLHAELHDRGTSAESPGADPSGNYRVASPGYFAPLSIPMRRGRTLTSADTERAPLVAVIDEAFARQHFADEDPIGRGIAIGNGTDGFSEVVGVVGSIHREGLPLRPRPTMYVPVPAGRVQHDVDHDANAGRSDGVGQQRAAGVTRGRSDAAGRRDGADDKRD
jgi:putative ABC transport system permease protein